MKPKTKFIGEHNCATEPLGPRKVSGLIGSGLTEGKGLFIGEGSNLPPPGVIQKVPIALDCDFEYYSQLGSVTAVQNDALGIMHGVNAIYQNDLNLVYEVTTIIVRTSPLAQYQNVSTPLDFLNAFRNYWNSNHGNIKRGAAHLISGKSFPTYAGAAKNRNIL